MFSAKRVLPLFLLAVACCATPQAQAQSSMPLYTTTYCVQVEWHFWRSGGSYWATEFETDELADAQLVLELFQAALANGSLCEILGCDVTSWVPVDVRLKTKYHWNIYPIARSYTNVTNLYYLRH